MLQPRPRGVACLLLISAAFLSLSTTALSENSEESSLDEKIRNKRESKDGDVTVLSLEESGRLREPPLGILSSTARTFVNDGATTEFATQIIGTTVGRTYARLLSTGTRVYYGNNKHTKDPYLVFPSIPGVILPTKTAVHLQTAEPVQEKAISLNEISESGGTEKPEPVVSVRKEFSVKRNTEVIRPAKVKPKSDLPTVTIKNEFSPSGYSSDLVEEKREEKKPRGGKGLFRGGVPVKNDFQKYDTVTYVGFADFTTTVGNTVIIFMPKTSAPNTGPVTSISGAATLRPEDVSAPVVSTVKTFLSHSPGVVTKTFSEQNAKMHTSVPTIQADIRASKAYNPVFKPTESYLTTEEPTTNQPTTNPPTTTNPPQTTNQQVVTEAITEHSPEGTTEEEPHFEPSETSIPEDQVKPTPSIVPTYHTTKTQVFIPGDKPLGLAKSIAVVEAYDETTTYLTSFLFGTVVNGEYTQLTQVASSTSVSDIKPTSVSDINSPNSLLVESTTESASTEEPLATTEKQIEEEKEKPKKDEEKPSINYITRIIPSTIYQTYTYFTTFFIPNSKGEKSTSIKSREVVTSEVQYVTTSLPPPGYKTLATISPTEPTTPLYQTTTEGEEHSPTTEETVAEPTPELPDIPLISPTTEEHDMESISTTESTTTKKVDENNNGEEEEVELIIKTLYTTYTYLTTFFQDSTSSVKSREVVETNVVTTTLDSEFKATDPAVAGLLKSFAEKKNLGGKGEQDKKINPSKDLEIKPSSTEFVKTYTYYTTIFVDGETIIESSTEVVTETLEPTSVSNNVQYKTASAEDNNVVPRREDANQKRKPLYGTISRPKVVDRPTQEALVMNPSSAALQSSIEEAYSYDTTMQRDDRIVATQSVDLNIPLEAVNSAREEELKKEAMQAIGMTPALGDDVIETMVTDVTSSSSGGSRRIYDEYESDPNDQISSESNTEEIEPSRTPTIVLQTSYTTYTYFTTVYKGSSSHVVSRLDTVTNVVTETIAPTEIDSKLSPEEATLPITYFTTFTYWTTLYKGKSTMITSREETVSNVVTPTISAELASTPVVQATAVPTVKESKEITPTATAEVPIAPTTYYTTYTYFTTSYIGNETIVNSHLETETNVVTPTAVPQEQVSETSPVEEIVGTSTVNPAEVSPKEPALQPTGLISTIKSSEVKDGLTTLYNTDVYGTYIDGLYAQVLESSTEIVAPTSASSTTPMEEQPTGVVSVNEGKIADADGISTTLFTTKAIGTYIDGLYAQVIESTSSIVIDEEKKTATPPLPSTTIIGSKTYTTGLVRLIEGSIVKDGATTFYESRVIGTLIDGRYAQIIESTSSFKLKMESTAMPSIQATPIPTNSIEPTSHVPGPSSSVIESSQNVDTEEQEHENDTLKGKIKTKASKASIRPFASRARPTYLPKRKDPATTITRTSFTPTVTATPASKSKGFGSSRNRFAANRSKTSSTPVTDIKPTSSSRRFGASRTRSASSSVGFGANRGRSSSSLVRPTISASSSRRGGFNYRSTAAVRPSVGASRPGIRIRPTQPLGPSKASAPPSDEINNDINQVSTEDPLESVTAVEEDTGTTSAPTTTESPRRSNNPLLRFRRPPILQRSSTTTTTPKPTTTAKRTSLLRRPDARAVQVTTTPRPRSAAPSFTRKPRPGSNLFPPRGLLRKPGNEQEEEKAAEQEQEEEEEEQPEIDIQDNEYEGSETSEHHSSTTTSTTEPPKRRGRINPISIRPFSRRPSRTKRQADYGNRYQGKFRRNRARTTVADYEEDYEPTPAPSRQTTPARYQRTRSRTNNNNNNNYDQQPQSPRERVRPSPVTSSPRHQFTLRERSGTTPGVQRGSYRRPTTSPRRRTDATTIGRPKAPRLRTHTTEASPRTTSRRFSSSSRGSTRTTSRSRHRDSDFDYYSPPPFDGTITVTHNIPTEVTLPVVNGKNTEYKNVITAKPSLEVLGPYQYTTTTKDGKPIIQLTTELTSTLPNGLMEVTKYLVYETPTTSVTFTPTTLRGRKTSFSHVVPSTVYEVRPDVSTIQPNLGNAPLANILLSQLLLGNLGVPNTAAPGVPQSPTTEFKTKTTTYVTTVTSHTSTILPLTFRGKEITTTIVDSSTQVITATEYITETIVITPTAAVAPAINNQLNTLLLPALLQAQLLQPPQPPLQNIAQQYLPKDPLYSEKVINDEPDQRFAPRDDPEDGERKIREFDDDAVEEEAIKPTKKGKIRLRDQKPPDKVQSTSVVTLYVSGKHPGEFTTLLSTVVVEDSSNLKKREIDYNSYDKNDFFISVSKLPELGASEDVEYSFFESAPNDILIESSEIETMSGDNGHTKHLVLAPVQSRESEESTTGHFLSQGPADSAPEQREASTRSISLVRQKREIEEDQPRRKRIRIRVPIRRYKNETGYLPSESAQVEDVFLPPEQEVIPGQSHNQRRVKVIRKKVDQPSNIQPTPNRKRVLVKKTKLIEAPETRDESDFSVNQYLDNTQSLPKRKKVLVARKRLNPYENVDPEPTQKRRIVVTRRRPVPTEGPQEEPEDIQPTEALPEQPEESESNVTEPPPKEEEIVPTEITIFADSPMATLYNYHYSIPSEPNEGKVMVSEIFMTGDMPKEETEDGVSNAEYDENEEDEEDETEEQPTTPKISEDAIKYTESAEDDEEEELPLPEVQTEQRATDQPVDSKVEKENENENASRPETSTEPIIPSTEPALEDNIQPPARPEANDSDETAKEDVAEAGEGATTEALLEKEDEERKEGEEKTEDDPGQEDEEVVQYEYKTRLTTTTRLRTYTYVVTRASGTEQVVTSSTTVKPDLRTVTVTELVPILRTPLPGEAEGRGYHLSGGLSTKRMSNGVEVIVAGGKGSRRPVTFTDRPATLSDAMMMLLPQETQKPHNEFVTKTYMTTYTYFQTYAQDGSTVVSSREKVVSNVVTEEIKPSKTKVNDHFTLTASPDLTTGVYHTTYTYLNTLVEGEKPLVVTSKKTVANTVTEQPTFIQPSEVPLQDTNTYLSTVAYTKTLSEGDQTHLVSTEDVLTQVVITESDFIPSSLADAPLPTAAQPLGTEIKPTPITTNVVKTYYATYTYFKTNVENGKTIVASEVVTSSDVATETFTIQPKRSKPIENLEPTAYHHQPEGSQHAYPTEALPTEPENHEVESSSHETETETPPLNLYATKTYLTTFTYFTTLLQENKTPSIVVSSSTEVRQNIVTETVNPSLLDSNYLEELKGSVNEQHRPVTGTATLNDGSKMEITAMGGDMMKLTDKVDTIEATSTGNVVTGSTIIFFDDYDPIGDPQPSTSTESPTTNHHYSKNEPEPVTPQPATSGASQNPVQNILLGMNALGPVINAMADLFQGKLGSGKKEVTEKPHPVFRPQDEPPRPVYVPSLDSEVAESQNVEGHNIYADIHQRTKNPDRASLETAILSGGIPISPGEVITTNSDVIIGKHSVHGPRPPLKPFDKEVEGMKPPPLPSVSPSKKEPWPPRNQERYPSGGQPPQRHPPADKLPLRRDPPHFPQNAVSHKQPPKNSFIDLHHEGTEIKAPSFPVKNKPLDSVPQSSKPVDVFHKPVESNKHLLESHINRRPPPKERPSPRPTIYLDDTTDLRPPAFQSPPQSQNYIKGEKYPIAQPLPTKETFANQPAKTNNQIIGDVLPSIPQPQLEPSKAVEQTGGDQLLVNIQPSQVANVIIPHGVPTALVYNKEPEVPSQKGEIFSEPSPYPDAEVGIDGVAGIARPDDEHLHATLIPSNAVRMDVPVPPQGIGVGPLNKFYKDEKKKNPNHPKKPVIHPEYHVVNHGLNYMTPPPPPPVLPQNVNYHFSGKEEIPDQDAEYSQKNEFHAPEEDDIDEQPIGFISQINGNPATISPADIQVIPSGNSDGVSFSVINSKPVLLGNDSPENQAPIIKGRPGVSTFSNNSEATLSVGQMTNLQPNEDLDIPSNPLYNVHSSTIIRKPQYSDKNNRTRQPVKPFDNTVYTMNMDEKPPLQAFQAPPHKINYELPLDMELMRLTPRPSFENTEDNVVGLTPPALSHRPSEPPTSRRPAPSRRPPPSRKRPPPPYKFEVPTPLDNRLQKPKPVPVLPDTERPPPPPPVPTEVLSPPKQVDDSYFPDQSNQFTTPSNHNLSPVLGGSLKVEENNQKPEVITAESKVINSNPKVEAIKKPTSPLPPTTKIVPTYAKPNFIITSHANELIIGSETTIHDEPTSRPTEALSSKTRPISRVTPTPTYKFTPRSTTSRYIRPTNTIKTHKTAIPLYLSKVNDSEPSESMQEKEKVRYNMQNFHEIEENYPKIPVNPRPTTLKPSPTTHIITHTQTLTVTTTESRIVQSKGQKPSTHTLVVTKTLMSTILDTVTEVHTVVKPTSIMATVTTTIPQATTTVYPTVSTQRTPSPTTTTKDPEKKTTEHVEQKEVGSNHKPNNNYHQISHDSKGNNHNHHHHSEEINDNESILVVMTDQNTDHQLNHLAALEPAPEIEGPEIEANEVAPNVLLSGVFSQYNNPGSECRPECRAAWNERCQKIEGIMRCACRPGFARTFLDQPCKPTYTFSISLPLEKRGSEWLIESSLLNDNSSEAYQNFIDSTREGIDRMVMQSEIRDVYHGLAVTGLKRSTKDNTAIADFYIQLSENYKEEKLTDMLKKYLETSNYSVGGTDLIASRAKIEHLKAKDFDECSDEKFHDCSENAQCFNLRGSYTCSCKEGFTDLSHNTLYPGRVCSADMIGCERCNYHGKCYQRTEEEEEEMCECFHWYAGEHCQINLKVLLLILVLVGVSLGVLLVVCLILSCMRDRRPVSTTVTRRVVPPGFRLRPPPSDKRAMISLDTASEASLDPPPFVPQPPPVRTVERMKGCRKTSKAPSPPAVFTGGPALVGVTGPSPGPGVLAPGGGGTLEQRDRSLTVMIPRAKYRPVSSSNLLTMSTFGPEQKLLKYLTPERPGSRNNSRKPSNSTNHSHESSREREAQIPKKPHTPQQLRKPSTGALVSAGFEVSATVGRTKNLQENFISEPHTDLNQPGFSTIRTADSSIIVDIPPPPTLEAELLDASKIDYLTVSEVRSYDETTIHPATKSLRIHYDKNDDSHTMVERDLGSTFIMPQSQLFKPARSNGSDISNFDSL